MSEPLKDINGKILRTGNILHGSYGIPPVGIKAIVRCKPSRGYYVEVIGSHKPKTSKLGTFLKCTDAEVEE